MRKILLTDIRTFSIVEETKPSLSSASDVLIKISAVGICGSDVHYYKTGRIGDQIIQFPFTLGHECSGIVEEVGENVTTVRAGDRIAIDPAIFCGTCDQCLTGRYHTCRNLKFLGNPKEIEGSLKEYLILPETCCFKLPDTVSLNDGIGVEPLTVGLHASCFNQGEKSCAILGFGPIGLCTFYAQNYRNPGMDIFVTDKIDDRVSYALNKGAKWAGNPLKHNVVKEIVNHYPQGVDTVYECCGQQEAINQAIELLIPGGQLIIIGIHEEDAIEFDTHKMRRKEISVQNVRRQNEKYPEALELLAKKLIDFSGFISHKFKIDQIQEGFELVEGYRDGVIKAIIEFE